jgi:hypothetical protein
MVSFTARVPFLRFLTLPEAITMMTTAMTGMTTPEYSDIGSGESAIMAYLRSPFVKSVPKAGFLGKECSEPFSC